MTKSSIVILDIKGNINSEKAYSRLRHETYAKKLSEVSINKPLRLIVISSGKYFKKDSSENIDFFQIKSSKLNFIGFISKSLWIVKRNNLKVKVVVCGDPWESFLLGKIFCKSFQNRPKIQVQVHADISDKNWEGSKLKHLIRLKLQNYAIIQADNVRTVSEDIAKYIRLMNPSQMVVVTPIPINLSFRKQRSVLEHREMIKIGFFGRLHRDRGTEIFLELIKKLNSYRQDFSIVVAGCGPEEFRFKSELHSLLGFNRVEFLGFLEQPELWKSLTSLDIYFSLAPSESYGLGLREAVIAGVPVISLESNGVRDARMLFGEKSIRIIDLLISSTSLSQAIDDALNQKPNNNAFSIQEALNANHLNLLIESWLEIADFG